MVIVHTLFLSMSQVPSPIDNKIYASPDMMINNYNHINYDTVLHNSTLYTSIHNIFGSINNTLLYLHAFHCT
jgi:hypothetical protein